MLTREVMGLALLGLAWVTAFMVALDALIDARAMRRRLATWKRSLVAGTVTAAELATHEIEQRVKQLDGDSPGLVFFDRKHTSTVTGGAVLIGADALQVQGTPGAEVWTAEATRAAAAQCASSAAFDTLMTAAQGAGGGLRAVRTSLNAGAPVWLVGERRGEVFEASLVAGFDPRTWATGRLFASLGVVALNFAWVAVGTALALWPPVFGAVSTMGAVALIGHFLGMTPIAMAAREKSRTPAFAFVRGTWRRSTASATALTPLTER